jgi:hypothetical protein
MTINVVDQFDQHAEAARTGSGHITAKTLQEASFEDHPQLAMRIAVALRWLTSQETRTAIRLRNLTDGRFEDEGVSQMNDRSSRRTSHHELNNKRHLK